MRRSSDSNRPAAPQRAQRSAVTDAGWRSAGGSSSRPSATSNPRARASRRWRARRSRSVSGMGSLVVMEAGTIHCGRSAGLPPGRNGPFPRNIRRPGGAGSHWRHASRRWAAMQDSRRALPVARHPPRDPPPWLTIGARTSTGCRTSGMHRSTGTGGGGASRAIATPRRARRARPPPTPVASWCRPPRPAAAPFHPHGAGPRSSRPPLPPPTPSVDGPRSPPLRRPRRRHARPASRAGSSSPPPGRRPRHRPDQLRPPGRQPHRHHRSAPAPRRPRPGAGGRRRGAPSCAPSSASRSCSPC